jgi:hypothetical protein
MKCCRYDYDDHVGHPGYDLLNSLLGSLLCSPFDSPPLAPGFPSGPPEPTLAARTLGNSGTPSFKDDVLHPIRRIEGLSWSLPEWRDGDPIESTTVDCFKKRNETLTSFRESLK